MNYREVTLLAKKTLDDSGTETFPIRTRDPITELGIYFEQNNPAAANLQDYPPERQISKIEIVDGGQTWWSLSGREAVGVAVPELGRWPSCFYNETMNQNTWIYIPIRFGRYLGDPSYGFDPTKLSQPQLKITYALGGHLTGNNELAIFAKVMENAAPPPQCLLWRTTRGFTSPASTTEPYPLPTDHPYRRLMIRAWYLEETLSSIISNYKLTCDVDKLTIFDLGAQDMYALIKDVFGEFYSRSQSIVAATAPHECWVSPVKGGTITPILAGYNASMFPASGSSAQMAGWNVAGAHVDTPVIVKSEGINPHNCVQYQFGQKDDPDTWFDPSVYDDVRLELEHGWRTAELTVAVQQPRTLAAS